MQWTKQGYHGALVKTEALRKMVTQDLFISHKLSSFILNN